MEKNKYSKNLNKYEQLYFLIEDYAKEYANLLEDKDNRTNENRCERYYKKVHDFVRQELDKAREEGYDQGVKDGMKGRVFKKVEITEEIHVPEEFLDKAREEGYRKGWEEGYEECKQVNKELSKLKQ